jgi:hypothetical protein
MRKTYRANTLTLTKYQQSHPSFNGSNVNIFDSVVANNMQIFRLNTTRRKRVKKDPIIIDFSSINPTLLILTVFYVSFTEQRK